MNNKLINILTHFLLFSLIAPGLSFPSEQIEVIKLKEGVYIYRSFFDYKGDRVSANGVIVESFDSVALMDTPWDDRQTIQLLNWIKRELNKPVAFAVITHAHMDRIGGINVLKDRNVKTISNDLTVHEAEKNGFRKPVLSFRSDTLLPFGNSSLEAFYPGPGHTSDNIVVYLKEHDILYGGCFIKSVSSTSLGNLEDAVPAQWSQSLKKVMKRYPDRSIVIPGHGQWKRGAIENTLELLSAHK